MGENDSVDERRPFIDDLRILHWYARSHLPGEKLSEHGLSAALAELGIDLSVDAIGHAITRLELEFDVILLERRPTRGARGKEIVPNQTIPEHFDHPEDWAEYPSPEFSSRRKSRLTLDGAIFAEVASLVAGYELIAREATRRTASKEEGVKARPNAFDRKAVLGWLRLERRRLQTLVEKVRSPDASVFHLRADDADAGLVGEPIDRRIMEFTPPRTGRYPEDEPQLP